MTYTRPIQVLAILVASASLASAQTLDDGILFPRRTVGAGSFYAHDTWNTYWEGTLKRDNGNIGTLTTQSVVAMAGYGVTERVSVIATLPYIWTEASQGVMQPQRGLQDVTIGVKVRALGRALSQQRYLNVTFAGAVSVPASDYTPDFLPLSIGSGGARATGRAIVDVKAAPAWYLGAYTGYTWCHNVRLDRNSYYTDGRLYLTNEVAMHDIADYGVRTTYARGRIQLPLTVSWQRTLGGGDIRRQDMPFIADRADFTRLSGALLIALPQNVVFRMDAGRIVQGRNVGQSTTFMTGLMYALHL